LSILANEVNGDVVNFNKVYNNFEDAGLFMTVPEKINQQYLSVLVSWFDQTRVRFGLIANRSIICEATPCAFNEEESA
jgi:hypothetical protein